MPKNAYELYEAVYDTARSEYIPADREAQIDDVIRYADGAFDLCVDRKTAEAIVDARAAFVAATDSNGEGQNNHYHLVQAPLSEVMLEDEGVPASEPTA